MGDVNEVRQFERVKLLGGPCIRVHITCWVVRLPGSKMEFFVSTCYKQLSVNARVVLEQLLTQNLMFF